MSPEATSVEASLEAARVNTTNAQELMRTVRADLEAVVETGSKEEVRAAFTQAKADIKGMTQSLKTAYQDIRKAIAELKALIETEQNNVKEQVEEAVQATTTTETEQ